MKDNIYDLLNDAKLDLKEYEGESFNDLEKKQINKRLKRSIYKNSYKRRMYIAASITLLVISLMTTRLGYHALAYAHTISYDIAHFLGLNKDISDYTTVINTSVIENGITIQLNQVVLDNNQLIVSTTSTADKKLGEDEITLFGSLYTNGRRISSGASGGSTQLDDYTVETVLSYELNQTFKGNTNIQLRIFEVMVHGKTIKGPWTFKFVTNGTELELDTEEIPCSSSFTLENEQIITLENYRTNDLGQKIYFTKSPSGTSYDLLLQGHDDLGNQVMFYVKRQSDNNGFFLFDNYHGNLDENAQKLTLTPYAVKYPESSGKLSNDYAKVGEAFTINLK